MLKITIEKDNILQSIEGTEAEIWIKKVNEVCKNSLWKPFEDQTWKLENRKPTMKEVFDKYNFSGFY